MNDDLISRKAAIELILSGKVGDDSLVECPEECNSFLDWAAEEVGKMPPAERKKGRWSIERLFGTDGRAYEVRRCSICDGCYQDAEYGLNFCPNCGAEMENSDDCD